ncbi:MAG: MipA/OmpV family protein [Pseudomonadales bacterium]
MNKLTVTLSALALAVGANTSALAGEFTVGAGVTAFESPYIDFKDDSQAFPFIKYQGDGWDIGVEGVNYRFLGSDESDLQVSATLAIGGAAYDSDDSDHFVGMEDRDNSVDAGISAQLEALGGTFGAQLLGDVSSTHDGFTMDLNYSRGMPLAGGFFEPVVGLELLSEDYTDYYYGVKTSEARAGRAAYSADGALNAYIGYSYVYPVNEQLSVIHNARYTRLSDEISDSSLVDRDNTWSASLGLIYRF